MAHHYCNCVGAHKPGCPNANDPNGMPPLTPDKRAMADTIPCGNCNGTGVSPICPTATCTRCQGSGVDPYAHR